MKKSIQIILVSILCFIANNIYAAIPEGYTYVNPQPSRGVNIYGSSSGAGKILYVIEADASRSNINFGLTKSGTNKESISEYWDDYGNQDTIAVINGQFFNLYTGKLSFPVKANNIVLESNYNEPFTYKSFARFNGTNGFMFNGFSTNLFRSSKDYIMGLHPKNDNKSKYSYIPRTFMAVKRVQPCFVNMNSCPISKYYFFVDDASTQSMMVNNIKQWGINENDIIMLDGGGSTQICGKGIWQECRDFGEARPVPHAIMIGVK